MPRGAALEHVGVADPLPALLEVGSWVDRDTFEEYTRRTRDDLRNWVFSDLPREQVIEQLCARWRTREELVLPYSDWMAMFRHVGYLESAIPRSHGGQMVSVEPPDRSEFPMRLWRSATPDCRDGMSWAARVELALEHFLRASAKGVTTRLWYVDLPDASHLLAWFSRDTDEGGELLVDCSRLRVRPATQRAIDLHLEQARRMGLPPIWPGETR